LSSGGMTGGVSKKLTSPPNSLIERGLGHLKIARKGNKKKKNNGT